MKRGAAFLLVLLLLAGLLAGCGDSSPNRVVFTGVLEEIHDSSLLVSTTDDVGFELASVSTADVEIDFNLIVGQKLKITIDPLIAESYPVQVNAQRIDMAQ